MSNDLTASLRINLGGNLPRRATNFAGSVRNIGSSAVQSGGLIDRSFRGLGKGLDRLANRYTALIGGIGGAAAVRDIAGLQRQFTRLGIQVGASDEQMQRLKERIFDVSRLPDIKINPDQVIEAVNQIVDKTGDLKFAEGNIENLAIAIQATGAAGSDVGQIFVDLKTKFKLDDPVKLMQEFSRLVEQGKKGSFPLEELGRVAPRVLAAYASLNREGSDAVREVGSLLQVFRAGVGSAENGATALEGVIRDIQSKIAPLENAGIKIIEDEETNKMRSLPAILTEVFAMARANPVTLRKIFGDESFKGINALLTSFDKKKVRITELDKFSKVEGDIQKTTEDAARAAKDAQAVWDSLAATWRKAADNTLLPILKGISSWTDGLKPGALDSYANSVIKLGGAFAGIAVARKLGVGSLFRSTIGRSVGKKVGGKAGVAPVYVTNMPSGLGGSTGGSAGSFFSKTNKAAGGGKKSLFGRVLGKIPGVNKIGGVLGKIPGLKKISKLAGVGGKLAKFGGKALPFAGALFTAVDIGSTLLDDSKSTAEKVADTVGPTVGSAIGGAIGSAILPGIGTMAGISIGSALGTAIGHYFADEKSKPKNSPEAPYRNVDLNMVLDMSPDLRKLVQPKRVKTEGDILLRYRSGPMMAGAQ